jgi:hypothetical protein
VCDRVDERDNDSRLKLLCWEDIDLWVLRDPAGNGGRDRLAMQVLLRYHKGENNKIVPTWYIFIEEALPALCPITHILAKALAEGVIANEGYQTKAEPFFTTKLNKRTLKVWWKKEWLHKPVFRKTELRKSVERKLEMEIRPATQPDALFGEGFKEKEVHREVLRFGDGSDLWEKSDDALTAAIFDGHLERLRIAMGLLRSWHSTVNHEGMQNASIVSFPLTWSGGVLTLRSKLSSVCPRPRDAAQSEQHHLPGILQQRQDERRRPGRLPRSRHAIALPGHLQPHGPPPGRERPEESAR